MDNNLGYVWFVSGIGIGFEFGKGLKEKEERENV